MSDITLEVQTRDVKKENNSKLRKSGIIPAIIYGHGKDNLAVKFNERVFLKIFKGAIASNIFIDLKIDNDDAPSKTVFIKEVQRSNLKRELEHIDFMEINPDEKIVTHVPVHLSGDAYGVTNQDGILEFVLRAIEVECLPKFVPKEISLDISNLKLGESIHVSDLKLDEKVKLLTASDATIVSVAERKVKEEKAEAEEAASGEASVEEKTEEKAEEKK